MALTLHFLATVVVAAGSPQRQLWEQSPTNTFAANAVIAVLPDVARGDSPGGLGRYRYRSR
jgi:hypothetical protein